MIELISHFQKDTVSKYEVMEFLKGKIDWTCFIVEGTLTLEGKPVKKNEITDANNCLKRSVSCHLRQPSLSNGVKEKNLKLLKF
jgi:hypothetical protein